MAVKLKFDAVVQSLLPSAADVMAQPKRQEHRHSRWSRVFDAELLPPGARTLAAWAFDAENCRAYPIKGVVNLAR